MAYGVNTTPRNLGTGCQNTMTTFRNEEEDQSQVVSRANLHYLLQLLAGLAEDRDRKPLENSRLSDEQTKADKRHNGIVL